MDGERVSLGRYLARLFLDAEVFKDHAGSGLL
jgi:hypothetical protein